MNKIDIENADWRKIHYIANTLKKGRIYVKSPSEAPKGASVKRGPRGGYYYESSIAEKPNVSKPIKSNFKETDIDFPGLRSVENFIDEVPAFENLIVKVNGVKYYMVVEEWFPDCLESRGMGKTTPKNIRKKYLQIMQNETGLRPDAYGYSEYSSEAEYGRTYIMQKV